MDVRNCKKCGKLYNYVGGMPICPACKEKAEETFQDVKKYIREHPRADIMEVAEACEVEKTQIQQWIREERLEFTTDSPIMIPCENCGAMIRSGKYCDKCKDSMARNLSNAMDRRKPVQAEPERKQEPRNRMHFLDKH